MPAIRMLHRALPDRELVLAMPGTLGPLAQLAGFPHRILDTSGLAALPWSGPPPEHAVDLHGKGPQSHRLLQALAPRRLVGFRCPDAGVDGPEWLAGEHEVSRWTRLVTESYEVERRPDDLRLATPAVPPRVRGAVVVHPGAAFASRRWPPERFAAVAARAAAEGLPVVVTGSAAESALVTDVCAAAGLSAEHAFAGTTSLTELAALVAHARVVICGDTGVAHLATAFATASVVLFGPVSPSAWGPPAAGPHRVVWHGGERGGDPWGQVLDPALATVTVDEVWQAASDLVQNASIR